MAEIRIATMKAIDEALRKSKIEAIAFERTKQQYQLLDVDDDNKEERTMRGVTENIKKKERKHKSTHLRRKWEEEVVDKDEEVVIKRGRWQTRQARPKLDANEEVEQKRDTKKNQWEEELEEWFCKKDASSIKRFKHKFKLPKKQEEETKRQREAQDPKELIPNLWEFSKEKYLKKKEVMKLQELEELIDEEHLFGRMTLTTKEQEKYKYKEEASNLRAKQHTKKDDNNDNNHMPEAYNKVDRVTKDKSSLLALEHYKDVDGEEKAHYLTQEAWEKHQIDKAILKFGAANKKKGDDYGYVFEDPIDFIQATMLAKHKVGKDANYKKKSKISTPKIGHQRLLEDQKSLPVYAYREQFLHAIRQHQILVIEGETGSGKTTQIPQYLHEVGYSKQGKIGCTQPRRVAAMSVAARVAQEMRVKLGHEVGYSIRFEDCTSNNTILKYMTDGMLLREFLGDENLTNYSVMMVDEAHERTLSTDILFGLLKGLAKSRPDFKLIVSSATLDAKKFSNYFDKAPIFHIPGRRFPVEIIYTNALKLDYVEEAIERILKIHAEQPLGDVLVFFTGQEEIERAEKALKYQTQGLGPKMTEMIICPFYRNLPTAMQAKVFEETPKGARKVVLATNIAETSLTIDGIKYVIDTGYRKQKRYSPQLGMESLDITPISQAAAQQRTGRAGRTSFGKCYRLYSRWSFQNEMDENTTPEIQRTNLGNVVLLLKTMGIHDIFNFDFMDHPPREALLKALEELYALGALNDGRELTKMGSRMAKFPLDPKLSKMLVASDKYKCSEEIVTICAMLSVDNSIFYYPKDKKLVCANNAWMNFHAGNVGDHVALMKVYDAWKETNYSTQWCFENYIQVQSMKQARAIRDQLKKHFTEAEIDVTSNPNELENIRKAITSGFFLHSAKLQKNGSYQTLAIKNHQTLSIHPSSSLFQVLPPKWILYHQLVNTTKEYVRQVMEIKPEWLKEIAPHYFKS